MTDEKREDGRDEDAGQARTFTEEQGALFSNPHGTPESARPRTPGAESVPPTPTELAAGGGVGETTEEG